MDDISEGHTIKGLQNLSDIATLEKIEGQICNGELSRSGN